MSWIDAEIVLVSLAAMFSPTTLSFSVLALVLGDRPLRTGVWFYLGAFTATLAVGIVAAFVLGDIAASDGTQPKTWVAVLDIIGGALLLIYVVIFLRRPRDPARAQSMIEKMSARCLCAGHCGRRCGCSAGKSGWLHPDRSQGHLGAEPERGPVRRRLAVLHLGLAVAAGARAGLHPGCTATGRSGSSVGRAAFSSEMGGRSQRRSSCSWLPRSFETASPG